MSIGISTAARPADLGHGRRRPWARLGLALAPLLAGSAAMARTAPDPYQQTTAEGHWAALGGAGGASLYYRPTLAFSPAGYRLLFGRIEYPGSQSDGAVTYRSERVLVEFDCLRKRERELRRTEYAEHNLEGLAVEVPASSDWRRAQSDARARVQARAACKSQ